MDKLNDILYGNVPCEKFCTLTGDILPYRELSIYEQRIFSFILSFRFLKQIMFVKNDSELCFTDRCLPQNNSSACSKPRGVYMG